MFAKMPKPEKIALEKIEEAQRQYGQLRSDAAHHQTEAEVSALRADKMLSRINELQNELDLIRAASPQK